MSLDTPTQLNVQMKAHAAAILAQSLVMSSFQHSGIRGMERESPIREFLRSHLPRSFSVGQGAIACSKSMLNHQHDIIIADAETCFLLLATQSSQLFPVEAVQAIVEVRSDYSHLDTVGSSFHDVRCLQALDGLKHVAVPEKEGWRLTTAVGKTAPAVHTLVIYRGPKNPETMIDTVTKLNAEYANKGHDRMVIDHVLVLSSEEQPNVSSGYLIGYSRKETDTNGKVIVEYSPHYYPQYTEKIDGPHVIYKGDESFAKWYSNLLFHLSGVTIFPPTMRQYLGESLTFVPWTKHPY